MTRNPAGRMWFAGLGMLMGIGLAGCGEPVTDAVMFKPMRSLLRMQEPVRIGTTRLHMNPVVQAPWVPLEQALSKKLGRPVQVVAYRPFQIRSQMERGYLDLAILSATDFAQIGGDQCCELLAQPVNSLGQSTRHGLILAKKDAKVRTLADLKGQRFAFGPSSDAASHLAAAYALMEAGLEPADIPREMLPVPMARRHHMDSFEVAKAVAYEPLLPAGAVDEVDFASLPEKGGSIVLQTVGKDAFRVIGKTVDLPEGPIVASRKADPKLVAAVKEYLLSGQVPEKALKAMNWQKLAPVSAGEYQGVGVMVRKLREAGWVTEEVPQAPASEPAATQPVAAGME